MSQSPLSPIGQPPLARPPALLRDSEGGGGGRHSSLTGVGSYGQPLALTMTSHLSPADDSMQTQPLALTARSSAYSHFASNGNQTNAQPLELTVGGRNSSGGGSNNQPLRLTKGSSPSSSSSSSAQQTQPLALTSLSPSVCAQSAALPVQSVQMLTVIRPGHGGAGGSSRMMASQPRLAHNISPSRNSMAGPSHVSQKGGEVLMTSPPHSHKIMQPIIAPHGRLPIMPLHSSKAASRRLAVLQPRLPPQRSSSSSSSGGGGGGAGAGGSYIITNSPLSGLSPQTLRSLAPLGRSPPSSALLSGGPRGPSGVSPRSLLARHSPVSPKTLARLPLRALMRGGGHGGGGHGSAGALRALAVSSSPSSLRGMPYVISAPHSSHRPVFMSPIVANGGSFTVTNITPAHGGSQPPLVNGGSPGHAHGSMPLSLVAVSAASGGGIVMAGPHSLHNFANMDAPAYNASRKLPKMTSSGHGHGHRRSSLPIKVEASDVGGGDGALLRKSTGSSTSLSSASPDKGQSQGNGELSNGDPGVDVSAFDLDKVMEWKDGIGTLPGSNMKFRMNEIGMLEMVNDEGEGDSAEQSAAADGDVSGDNKANEKPASVDKKEPTDVTDNVKLSIPSDNPSPTATGGLGGGGKESPASSPSVTCQNCSSAISPSRLIRSSDGNLCSQRCLTQYRVKKSRQRVSEMTANQNKAKHQFITSSAALAARRGRKRRDIELVNRSSDGGASSDGGPAEKVAKLSASEDTAPANSDDVPTTGTSTPAALVGRSPVVSKKTKGFDWADYLTQEKAFAAPSRLFKESLPGGKNSVRMGFRVGMKLEGVDPTHPSLYCVLTVKELQGARLRLHFDGYSECYDFWSNCDSPFIFPVGWAERNGKTLQPPKGYASDSFVWADYLKEMKASAAPKTSFTNTPSSSISSHGFRVGHKLEAVDKKNNVLTCVATVADVLGERLLVHFDGWEDVYDYWCDPSSPYIHPVGWCQETGKPLSPPNNWKDIENFTWDEYLDQTKSQAVPNRAFKLRSANEFAVGMRLEVVDRRNTKLVRVATVSDVEPYRIKVHFDGWADSYDYWLDDDSADLHPIGWCQSTDHALTLPPSMSSADSQSSCPTPGCTGVGHMKGAKFTGHHSIFGCPYSAMNMHKETALPDRIVLTGKSTSEPKSEPMDVDPVSSSSKSSQLTVKCPPPGDTLSTRTSGQRLSAGNTPGAKVEDPSVPLVTLPNGTVKPLYGKGSGRGRKKKTVLKLIQQQKEMHARSKFNTRSMSKSVSPKSVSPANGGGSEAGGGMTLYDRVHESIFQPLLAVHKPQRDLPLGWDDHARILSDLDRYTADEVAAWSVDRVAEFVSALPGCSNVGKLFANELIDGEALLLLNQTDIVKIMNIKLGPAIKIFNSILVIKSNAGTQ